MIYKPLTNDELDKMEQVRCGRFHTPDNAPLRSALEQARRANRLAGAVSGYAATEEIREALAAYRGET